jgi:hypothetical protein
MLSPLALAMNSYLRRALDDIDRTVGGADVSALEQRLDGQWSVGEILEHLTLAFTANRQTLEKVLASGELRARRPRLTQRFWRTVVIELGVFPRVEAPEPTRPRGTVQADRSLVTIREALVALDATLGRVTARFGDAVPVSNHPFFAGLTARQWTRFHWRHTQHHMRQARRRLAGPR